jgi:hypothetical protein
MFLLSNLSKKLLELDENNNVVNSYDVVFGSDITLNDGRIFSTNYGCVVTYDDNGDIIDYEKVFVDVREFLSAQYLQNIGGK